MLLPDIVLALVWTLVAEIGVFYLMGFRKPKQWWLVGLVNLVTSFSLIYLRQLEVQVGGVNLSLGSWLSGGEGGLAEQVVRGDWRLFYWIGFLGLVAAMLALAEGWTLLRLGFEGQEKGKKKDLARRVYQATAAANLLSIFGSGLVVSLMYWG